MTNGEKHIEKLLGWYKEAVTENGVCYLTYDDKNTLAYAIKCCKHFEDIKKDIDSWMLREEPSSSGKPNKSEIPTGSDDCISRVEALNCLKATELKKFDWIIDAREKIGNMPSVTPIRPKGHWIEEKSIHGWDGHSYQCSVCGRSIHLDTAVEDLADYPYCHCGADLREVEQEPIFDKPHIR